MVIATVLVVVGLYVLYRILQRSGEADEQAEAMYQAMLQEQADAEAYRRLTE